MKNVVFASLLATAGAAFLGTVCFAQLGTGQAAGGQIQLSADEYAAYNSCLNPSSPAAKAPACEAYLKAYPNSVVKVDALQQLMFAYSQDNDTAHTLDAADRLLKVDPTNLRALTFEVYLRKQAADQNTDAAAKAAALDEVAGFAHTGLTAPRPKDIDEADWKTLTSQAYPTFESAIADDDIAKKNYPGAIADIKTELTEVPDATEKPGPVLQDIVFMANAYMMSTPPDYLDCAWYATRAASFAGTFAPQIQPLATYCYKKYHGNSDGYNQMQASVTKNLNPPPACPAAPGPPPAPGTPVPPPPAGVNCLTVTPAPKPEDIVANLIATTPDLATLAISDKEFVLQYGKPSDADKVFDTIKGKDVELPGVTVVSATANMLTVAVSDDAVQSKTADFTFNMKDPISDKDMPAVGAKVTLDGTYASYTQKPLMITMSNGKLVLPHKAPERRPVRRR